MTLYAEDERFEPCELPSDVGENKLRAINAVGVLVKTEKLQFHPDSGRVPAHYTLVDCKQLDAVLMEQLHGNGPSGVEPSIKFLHQTCLGFATAFLVSKTHIISAGHAAWNQSRDEAYFTFEDVASLDLFRFVLDWQLEKGKDGILLEPSKIPASNVYEIKKIQYLTPTTDNELYSLPGHPDFLIMSLGREVDRDPVEFAIERPLPGLDDAWTVGHPFGQPKKVDMGYMIRYPITPDEPTLDGKESFHVFHNLATYAGCSGSPIFDMDNHVVGIEILGEEGYAVLEDDKTIVPVMFAKPTYELWQCGMAMRTDSLRWLFRTDARIILAVKIDEGLQLDPFNLEIWHSRTGPETEDHNNRRIGELSGVTLNGQWRACDCTKVLKDGLCALDLKFWKFRLNLDTETGGTSTPLKHRVGIGLMRLLVQNPTNPNERFEFWDVEDHEITANTFTAIRFDRIIREPIWANGKWPAHPMYPAPPLLLG